MASELVCPCGQVLRINQPAASEKIRCPACGQIVPEPAGPSRKGLWQVMHSAPAESPPNDSPPTPESEIRNSKSEISVDDSLGAMIGILPGDAGVSQSQSAGKGRARESIKGLAALCLGGLSIPLSCLALVDTLWSKFPATLLGFAAILIGMQAASEIRHPSGRHKRRLAIVGIFCGVIGVFLGPLILAGIGQRMWQEATRSLTEGHLNAIGQALDRYHDEHGIFPPGGIFKLDRAKHQRGFHGWMTLLLPHLGEDDLFHEIRLEVPFDDKANREAFAKDVEVFFAAGGDRSKVEGRFGASHFAGVGGEVESNDGTVSRAGLFGVNSKVSRDDVVDGLANTLAAGEIADEYPPWGDPENWRTIGKGLNRQTHGFGNHDRSGACFLMADGSVRFFPNKTSPHVLTALSTRDGDEK